GEHSQNERNAALQALRDGRARVCVATDVAARGIDLPGLTLVIHVELPRDAEALQHRSGRTGRAGQKGTAVLIVPYPRRRAIERLLKSARIDADWTPPPGPEEILASDRARLLEALLTPAELDEEDRALGAELLAQRPPEDIAAMLVRAHRAALPTPEELVERGPLRDEGRPEGNRRAGFDDVVWFRLDIGRRQNADPRWILPLLCRRGHITKQEVGAIRIGPNDTYFQIPRALAGKFQAALKRSTSDDGGVIEPAPQGPAATPRHPRPSTAPAHARPRKPVGNRGPRR
ncbi:helicase-related protein, partial [Sphingomonas sp.]|uniref:helicase-related protein n=1 Tax=Sphingomonas sp. TaxID=28214 RepID=UPI001D6ECF60